MVAGTIFLAASVVVFGLYSPLVYGNQWTKSECNRVKLFDTWDWDCNTFPESYQQYALMQTSAGGAAVQTGQAPAHGPAPPVAHDPKADVHVTPGQGNVEGVMEEKIEYRDEDGNLLNDEQVAALEGKVSFQTRYETRTRLVDEAGNEVWDGAVGEQPPEGLAGTNIEGVEQETVGGAGEAEASTKPGQAEAADDVVKEKERVGGGVTGAEPQEPVGVSTGKDEL
jgi:dolichyl-phosphate-mannose-protein mannosyltransferase